VQKCRDARLLSFPRTFSSAICLNGTCLVSILSLQRPFTEAQNCLQHSMDSVLDFGQEEVWGGENG
jgi:hypothetical protein